MIQGIRSVRAFVLAGVLCAGAIAPAQNASVGEAVKTGQIAVNGHLAAYRIRELPVSSFPELPAEVAELLTQRGCRIPQTYQAHRPENVIQASLERRGSRDWAALCSAKGVVSLLVFFSSSPGRVQVLATAAETNRLQAHDASGVLGFNWGIDPASPQLVHENQAGLEHRPPPTDHDALADSILDRRTVYRFYAANAWTILDVPE